MNRKVIIIGASGHGSVIADIVRANNDCLLGFLDDDTSKPTIGTVADYHKYSDAEFVIGIGNAQVREKLSTLPVQWYTAIHPSAVVSPSARIDEGTVIMPNAVVNANSVVGKHCIINTGAIVEHNNTIGDFSHISVGVRLGGTVTVGVSTWIGIGAIVRNNISITNDCIIGAGAVVVKNINEKGTYVGVPAKKDKKIYESLDCV